jgi:hypothetical protein
MTYVYNVSEENRDRVENDKSREPGGYQYELGVRENEVRSRTPYKTLEADSQIVSVLGGGLGNMLFQTAAAKAMSLKFNKTLLLNPNHTGVLHKLPTAYTKDIFRNIPVLSTSLEGVTVPEDSFTYKPLNLPNDNVILTGYFQSPRYFKEYKSEILEMFKPTEEIISQLQSKYPILKENVVSIHVRRGDYVNLSNHHYNLQLSYYQNAISYFKGHTFLVFSDDIDWCKEQFKGPNFTFAENDSDILDLYLMSLCKHNIMANSTFSWWGAYLNQNSNKKVVYPNKWFGPANSSLSTCDLFPEEWICLPEESTSMEVNLIDNAFRHLAHPSGRYSHVHGKISKHISYVRDVTDYKGITLFTDEFLLTDAPSHISSKYKIGWLMESREIFPQGYINFESYKDNYDFILTHDPLLLEKYPNNTKFYPIGGCWISEGSYGLHTKLKDTSMIYSSKVEIEGHKLRHEIAKKFGSKLDLYGRGTDNPIEYKEEALVDYKYSIVVENTNQINYITEKIVDCLAVGTIPVYWGCPNISDFFDMDGIITFNTIEEFEKILPTLTTELYNSKIESVKKNLEKAKQYAITEDWLYENIFTKLT